MALIAVCIFAFSDRPMGGVAMFFCAAAMGFGAWLLVQPFLKNQTAELRGRDLDSLNPVSDQLKRLEELRHLLSQTVAKTPEAKDYEPTLKEISAAIDSIRMDQENSYKDMKNVWIQEIAGLESRALHAIQSLPKVTSAPGAQPAPAADSGVAIHPDQIAGLVSDRLRPEWTQESEKTLNLMKEHVDESFSQAMSEMADLKLALEQALETIANAAPGVIPAPATTSAPSASAQIDPAQLKEVMSEISSSLDTRLKAQARSVQRLSTEVGSLRRMMRRAMSVKGGSWNVELETDSDPTPDANPGNDSAIHPDWSSFTPVADPASAPETQDPSADQPDPNEMLEFPAGNFPSPQTFGALEEEVFPTQFTSASDSQPSNPPVIEPDQPSEPNADISSLESAASTSENSPESESESFSNDSELREWPASQPEVATQPEITEESSPSEPKTGEAEEIVQPEGESNEAKTSEESVEPESNPEPDSEVSEKSAEAVDASSSPEIESQAPSPTTEAEPEIKQTAETHDDKKESQRPVKHQNPKLPSVKSAVRNLFEEAEHDEDPN